MIRINFFFTRAIIVLLFLTIFSGCSSNSVKPIENHIDPQDLVLIYELDYTPEKIVSNIRDNLSAATAIKNKDRYRQTKDPRVPRPDLVLGKEVFTECSSPEACIITFVFHKGQFLGETKVYNSSTGTLGSTSKSPKITGEATTKQIIKVPVKITSTLDEKLKATLSFSGTVETEKYQVLFGLGNVISGSTYAPLLDDYEIINIYNAMVKILPYRVEK